MPDYDEMLSNIENAETAVSKGIKSLHPLTKLTQIESYVLGHLRAAQAVLEKARESIQSTRSKRERSTPASKEGDE